MADYLTQAICEVAVGGAGVLVKLTNDAGGATTDATVLAQLIAAAEADVNACIYKGFQGPITVVDHGQRAYDTIVQLCSRVFKYHAFSRREIVQPDSQIQKDYDTAISLAIEMAKGKKALAGIPPVPRGSPESPSISNGNVNDQDTATRPASRRWTRESQGNA
jgi:phage gp36-like protein